MAIAQPLPQQPRALLRIGISLAVHGPDGRDTMRDGIQPKVTSCPPHEEPAKAQKWE